MKHRRPRLEFGTVICGMALVALYALGCNRSASDCCGTTESEDTNTATDTDTDADNDTAFDSDSGGLLIQLVERENDAYGYVYPADNLGVSFYWTQTMQSGPCVFYESSLGQCDPECVLPMECGADNQCHMSYSPFVDAGTISVSGLKSALSLEVVSGGGPNYYYADNWNPALKNAEIFDEGDVIIASSAGGAYGSFEVQGQGCANLETDLSCPPAFVDGEPLEIQWTVGEKQGDTILFSMASGNHASNFSSILCKTEDTGLLRVDAALITAYLSDFHPIETWELSRFRDGVTTVKGKRIILRTQSIQSCRW